VNTTVIGFFNNKGGVGKTSLVYHLAWMFSDLGLRVVAADLDPQANLTSAFLNEDRLEALWEGENNINTVFRCVEPIKRGIGDIAGPHLEEINENIRLIVGDLLLSGFEDDLSEVWPKCMDKVERAFRVTSAFWRIMQKSAEIHGASVILLDLGPNLGAINRSALISSDYIVIPLSPDLFSLQGLSNLGPTLREWREDWDKRLKEKPDLEFELPKGRMEPVGYIVLQHAVRMDRPVKAYDKWIARIPSAYREDVLNKKPDKKISIERDPYNLSLLKHYRSLIPLAQEARKPIFHLTSADGALGSHLNAVNDAKNDFKKLAEKIAEHTEIIIPLGG
jgi:chromosome partitioning protein